MLAALAAGWSLCVLAINTLGKESRIVVSLIGDLVLLGASWSGYGPGLFALALGTLVIQPHIAPAGPFHFDPERLGLLTFLSLMVSTVSAMQRQAFASLRRAGEETRTWLAAMVESSDDGIIGNNAQGKITSWNHGAEVLFGFSSEEMLGRSIGVLVPDECAADVSEMELHIRNGQVVQNHETVRLHRDGRRIFVSITVSPVRDAAGIIQGVSTIARDITAHWRAQQKLEDSEGRYRLLFENNPQPMWVYDPETLAFLTVNNTAVHHYGYTREEFLQITLKDIRVDEDVARFQEAAAVRTREYSRDGPWRHRTKGGQIIEVESAVHPIEFEGRTALLVLTTDITKRLRLEEQYRQAQRMESIGRLAGGVAHDFNNLLTVINGYSEMLSTNLEGDHASIGIVREIQKAGERAADLTQQLLALSRRQVIKPLVININTVLRDTETLLRRLIGEDIDLVTRFADDLGQIHADPGQIQQIVMNLAVNSRDAMPKGGTLYLETANATLDETIQNEHAQVRPGSYVLLAVTDTGCGMSPEVRAKVFEPFFTTKDVGKGTGLGLATVYGMVEQGGGWIWLYSEPDQGTTFKIYLPRTDAALSLMTAPLKTDVRGHETILVVEDQAEVLKLALTGLASYGYDVYGVGTGKEALTFCNEFPGSVDLVVTDVVMPDMNGRQVAENIGRVRPQARILFMSGYTADVIAHRGVLGEDVEYLQKPFTSDCLARRIRETLAHTKRDERNNATREGS